MGLRRHGRPGLLRLRPPTVSSPPSWCAGGFRAKASLRRSLTWAPQQNPLVERFNETMRDAVLNARASTRCSRPGS